MKLHAQGRLCQLSEAAAPGTKWDVVVILVGESANGVTYTEQALREAASLFEGRPILSRPDDEHVQNKGTSGDRTVGWVSDVEFRGDGEYGPGLYATANILPSAPIRQTLVEAWEAGKKDLLGLSIVAFGKTAVSKANGKLRRVLEKVHRAVSVDVVVDPAAGGRFANLVAARGHVPEGADMDEKLAALLKKHAPEKHAALQAKLDSGETLAEAEVLEALDEAMQTLAEATKANKDEDEDGVLRDSITVLTEAVRGIQKQLTAKDDEDDDSTLTAEAIVGHRRAERLAESKMRDLPKPVQDTIRERLDSHEGLLTTKLVESIVDETVQLAGKLSGGFKSRVPSANDRKRDGGSASVVLTEAEKLHAGLVGFFTGKPVEVRGSKVQPIKSFRQWYESFTGDRYVTGQLAEAQRLRENVAGLAGSELLGESMGIMGQLGSGDSELVAEAINNTTFADTLTDAMHVSLVQAYNGSENKQLWRKVSDTVPLSDFRTQHAVRWGQYGLLKTVGEGVAYTAVGTPTDDKETYAPAKRGGLETITREAIKNDAVGAIRRIPAMIADAAIYTLNYFVLTTLLCDTDGLGAAMADGFDLFNAANHSNLTTVGTLSASSVAAARLAMRKQTVYAYDNVAAGASTRRPGLIANYLLVPADLEETAWETLAPHNVNETDTPDFVRGRMAFDVVDHWTDANNFYFFALGGQCGLFEVGFVDGQETPQMFLQDMPNVGSMFDSDQLTWKVRHEYGGAPVDWRGMYAYVVA